MHWLYHKHSQQLSACWQVDEEVSPPMMVHHMMPLDTFVDNKIKLDHNKIKQNYMINQVSKIKITPQ